MLHELKWHLSSGVLSFPASAQFSSETNYPERTYYASVGALTLECDRRGEQTVYEELLVDLGFVQLSLHCSRHC